MRSTFTLLTAAAGLAIAIESSGAQGGRAAAMMVTIPAITRPATPASVRALLTVISADSMEGRAVWKPGSDRAARYIAEQMRKIGLIPAGDSGYFQKIPGALQANGRVLRLPKLSDLDTVPAERRRIAVNVVGILPGQRPAADATRPDSVILVDAHYDHVGIGTPVNGDSIYNGADDDASGTVAVLEIARIMKGWPTPNRTVVFLATTGEEAGLVGTRWYIENPVRPIESLAANFEIEMIGRADTIAVGPGRAWLTGFERSTMGETFQRHGLPILADMRPAQSFFTRSDNIAFARAGIPAHTLSSFNLHTDYHRPSDDVAKVDFKHMADLINISARAVRVLTDGPAPVWHNGQRPCPGGGGRGRGAAIDTTQLTPQQRVFLDPKFPQSCR